MAELKKNTYELAIPALRTTSGLAREWCDAMLNGMGVIQEQIDGRRRLLEADLLPLYGQTIQMQKRAEQLREALALIMAHGTVSHNPRVDGVTIFTELSEEYLTGGPAYARLLVVCFHADVAHGHKLAESPWDIMPESRPELFQPTAFTEARSMVLQEWADESNKKHTFPK